MDYQHEWQEKKRPSRPLKPVFVPERIEELEWRMSEYLEKRGLNYTIAVENGWYASYYKSAPRVIIPASTLVNTWPYFQGRAVDNSPKRYESPSCPRGDALAVVTPFADEVKGVVIVEGPMDALAAAGEGYVGVALMGNTPGDSVLNHLEHLIQIYGDALVIPDKDALDKGAEVTAKLWARGLRCNLKQIQGKDLADLSKEKRAVLLADH